MTVVDDARAELYALAMGEFTAARQRLARVARQGGDLDAAGEIAALRKPTRSAWVMNLVTRNRPDLVADLRAVGESMRSAQLRLAGDELRRLAAVRRQCVEALVAGARQTAADAGHDVSAATLWELETTAQAALGSADVAALVFSGSLDHAVDPAGTGVDDPDDVARPRSAGTPPGGGGTMPAVEAAGSGSRGLPDAGAAGRAATQRRAVREGRARLEAARTSLAQAVSVGAAAREAVVALVGRRAELRAELEALRLEEVERNAAVRNAEQRERAARRELERAEAASARREDGVRGR